MLGEMYAQEYSGLCPWHFQEPYGKKLNISFIGLPPYITYNPIGGSEFIITNLLANKFKFTPGYTPAPSFDTSRANQTVFGMVDLVSLLHATL